MLLFCLPACENVSPSANESHQYQYPTILESLPATQLEVLQEDYVALNDNQICTPLDQFGFPEYSLGPCLSRPVLRVPMNEDLGSVVARAKLALVKNQKFTNASDTASLRLLRAFPLEGCIRCDGSPGDIQTIQWELEFANQIYNGFEVTGTQFTVFINAQAVFMLGGNWYKEIVVPEVNRISKEEARERLLGTTIPISGTYNNDVYTIRRESFPRGSQVEKMVLSVRKGDTIELRVVWRTEVWWGHLRPAWNVYVETTTGEVLKVEQMFIVN